jgi:hypothetical protein
MITALSTLIVAAELALLPDTAKAQVVDLTGGPNDSGSINGALFFASDQQPAGTGFIDSFLRVQNKGFEHGYNTDGGFPFDDKHPHNFQHSIPLAGLAQFNLNGIEYYKFMLDSNQNGPSAHQFSLDRLQLYTSNNPAQTTTNFSADSNGLRTLPLGHLAYTMNNNDGTGGYVVMTATGSGKFDAKVYVPVSDFNQSDKYVYLYMAGGDHIRATSGFEEWAAAIVPEPSTWTLMLGGVGLFLGFQRVCRWRS